MSRIRIEWVPIQVMNLGLFGFDHLQICYQTSDALNQDEWYVIEGIRGPWWLESGGMNGWTTLAMENPGPNGLPRYGQDLIDAIGTPQQRGSHALPVLDTYNTWLGMVQLAQDFDSQFVYSMLGIPGTVIPNSNSSSLVASILFHSGIDIANHIPYGMRRTSGLHTLLGTRQGEEISATEQFTTVQAGGGNDIIRGTDASEKLYGGLGDDMIVWSKGSNIIHGGQWRFGYQGDGTDTVDYTGAGRIVILKNDLRVEGATPDYIVRHTLGAVDHLYSIERVQWSAASDSFELEDVQIIEDGLLFRMGADNTPTGDSVEFAHFGGGILINPTGQGELALQAIGGNNSKGSWIESVESVLATDYADKIYVDDNLRVVDAGGGNDLIDGRLATAFEGASPLGYDAELKGGTGDDKLVANAGRIWLEGGAGADTFIISEMTTTANKVEIVIEGADAGDRLYIPYDFLNGGSGTVESSQLMPILGGIGLPGQNGTGIYSAFDWLLDSHRWYGTDMSHGVIDFLGVIRFDLQGADLLVHIWKGALQNFPRQGGTAFYDVVRVLPTETIVRVKDYQAGDLGINFYDWGPLQEITLPNGTVTFYYPNHDSIVQTLTSFSFAAPLEARPAALQRPTGSGPTIDDVDGTAGNDTISVNQNTYRIDAGPGADNVTTGAGNDLIDGGPGIDTMQGGAGNDTYIVDVAGDTIIETAGNGIDTVYTVINYTLADTLENLVLTETAAVGTGNASANVLTGNETNNTLYGLAGDDTLAGTLGDDTIIGGIGNDRYAYMAGDGVDVIFDQGSVSDLDVLQFIYGIAPADVTAVRPTSAPQDILLLLADGGRILLQGFGAGAAQSVDEVRFADKTVWTRATLQSFWDAAPMETNAAPWVADDFGLSMTGLQQTVPQSVFLANDRDVNGDVLTITSVSNAHHITVTLDGTGNLVLTAQPNYQGIATFSYAVSDGHGNTATANVEITVDGGGTGGVSLQGNIGNDSLVGTAANEFLDGFEGNDTLVGGGGADEIDGGAGFDFVSFASATSLVSAFLDGSEGNLGEAAGDVFRSIEGAIGSIYNDTLYSTSASSDLRGGDGDDNLHSFAGNDVLTGDAGHDNLYAGAGTDTLTGGAGIDMLWGEAGDDLIDAVTGDLPGDWDQMVGGLGNDTFIVNFGDWVYEPAAQGIDTLLARSDFDLNAGADIEILKADAAAVTHLAGNELSQTLTNNPGANAELVGGGGGDTITGGAGSELLYGDYAGGTGAGLAGNDSIAGNDGNDTIHGEAGDDTLSGGAGADLILGGTGNDLIDGGADADSLTGGSGLDTIAAGDGNDTIDGGDGNDTVNADGGNDSVIGGIGLDALNGGTGDDTLDGGADADVVHGDAGADSVLGGDGNDTLFGDAGADIIAGGLGLDTIYGGSENDLVDGGSDADMIAGDAGNDTLQGGDGDDILNGLADNDSLLGQAGNDTLDGGIGLDTLIGGAGLDSLMGGDGDDRLDGVTDELIAARDTLVGGLGNDTFVVQGDDVVTEAASGGTDLVMASTTYVLTAAASIESLVAASAGIVVTGNDIGQSLAISSGFTAELRGGGGNDTVTGGSGNDVLWGDFAAGTGPGMAGNDSIVGGGGNDTIYGEAGNDVLSGEAGADSILGGAGLDTITGGTENDVIDGGGDDDTIAGDAGNDTLTGGDGNDVLNGLADNDSLLGQVGNDTLDGGAGLDTLIGGTGLDSLMGGDGDDRLDGVTDELTAARDTLVGGLGNDTFLVQGDDVITELTSGGTDLVLAKSTYTLLAAVAIEQLQADVSGIVLTGNELAQTLIVANGGGAELRGGGGNDTLTGGNGIDTLWGDFANGTGPGVAGNDSISGGAGADSIYGEAGNDWLSGDLGADRVDGGAGNDTLYGSAGLDTLIGGTGIDQMWGGDDADSLLGGDGTDTLNGELGNDTLTGEAGNDTMSGGAGADRFVFRAGFGRDTILDFGTSDILDVAGFGATYGQLVFTQTAAGLEISSVKFGTGNVIVVENATAPIGNGQFLF